MIRDFKYAHKLRLEHINSYSITDSVVEPFIRHCFKFYLQLDFNDAVASIYNETTNLLGKRVICDIMGRIYECSVDEVLYSAEDSAITIDLSTEKHIIR